LTVKIRYYSFAAKSIKIAENEIIIVKKPPEPVYRQPRRTKPPQNRLRFAVKTKRRYERQPRRKSFQAGGVCLNTNAAGRAGENFELPARLWLKICAHNICKLTNEFARTHKIQKNVIGDVASGDLSGVDVAAKVNSGKDTAQGGFVGHCRKTLVIACNV
jgi:hypothetical protein